jgi:O-antigen ligase
VLVGMLASVRRRGIFLFLALLIMVIAVGALLAVPGTADRFGGAISRSGSADRGLTLSGRVDLWAIAIDRFTEKPLLGHGFYQQVVYNYDTLLREDSADQASHAHNMILQSLVSLGLAGTILLVPVFVAQIAHLARNRDSPLSPYIAFFLIMGLFSLGGLEAKPSASALVFMLMCVAGVAMHQLEKTEMLRRPAALFPRLAHRMLGAAHGDTMRQSGTPGPARLRWTTRRPA